jgi:methylated-DNA-[protein]-cysteine S-methyltransferase
MSLHYRVVPSPLGELLLYASESALVGLHVVRGRYVPAVRSGWVHDPQLTILEETRGQLQDYFEGRRRDFTVPLAPAGTPFQQQAWNALLDIPYGQTRSYGEQARSIGRPSATRAVGAANGRNPIAIIIPCHRVVGADGSLTGYSGGLEVKRYLLNLEGAGAAPTQDLFAERARFPASRLG